MPVHLVGAASSPDFAALAKRNSNAACQESPVNCIHIGLINNMPDGALQATERQFLTLLDSASDGVVVRLSLYALPDIPRNEPGRCHINRFYSSIENLWDSHLDGLIVTGAEPHTANLKDEPYWHNLTRVLDWAEHNTHSTVWSCLAAHAAVLHTDGIARHRFSDKRFGAFECAPALEHPLTAGVPSRFQVPQSRWNGIRENELTDCGYRVLTRTSDGDVDMFVRQRQSLFVLFQGHPEYEVNTLLLEYRRDIVRYLRRQIDTYPALPESYFDRETVDVLTKLRERALSSRREELLADFPTVLAGKKIANTWHPVATRIYGNWLAYLRAQSELRLKAGRGWKYPQLNEPGLVQSAVRAQVK